MVSRSMQLPVGRRILPLLGAARQTVFLSVGPEIGLVMSNAFGHLLPNERASDMRKSWKEYKREARQRQRTLDKERERELNTTVYRRSFSDFMREDHRSGFAVHFLILGNDWWAFEEDNGINPLDPDALDEDDRRAAFNSLGKAELVLSVLQDVVETLAQDIAAYKRREIEGRIEELRQLGFAGPDANRALDDLERLKKMRHKLSQRVRNTLPQTRASGE